MKPELEQQYFKMIDNFSNGRPEDARAELSNILTVKLADQMAAVNRQIAATHEQPKPNPAS